MRPESLFLPRVLDSKMNLKFWRLRNEIILTITGKLAFFHQGLNFGVHKSGCKYVKLIYGSIQELRLISDKFTNGYWRAPFHA